MKSISELFEQFAALDIKLSVHEGKLRVNAPNHVLTESLRAELLLRKPELIDFLTNQTANASTRPSRQTNHHGQKLLSFGQERLWSLARIEQESSRYNVPLAFTIEGKLDVALLERCLDLIQRRHSIMRTDFVGDDLETVRQTVQAETVFVLPISDIFLDLVHLSKAQAELQLKSVLETEIRRPFDISKAPLWRAHLYRLDKKRHVLALAMHHLIFDGVSQSIFLQELSECYQAFSAGKEPSLPLPAFEFSDFATWQRQHLDEKALQRQLSYWSGRLSGEVPPLAVPNDKSRSAIKGRAGVRHFHISPLIFGRLLASGLTNRASPYVMLMAVFAAVIHVFSGQEDLLICSPTSGRDNNDLEFLIGYFNSLVVLRIDLSGDPIFSEVVSNVRKLSLEALDNQSIPLQRIAQLPNLIRTPLTRAMFSYQDGATRGLELKGLQTSALSIRKDASDFELAMYTQQVDDKITGVLEFNAELFSEETITELLTCFDSMMKFVGENPNCSLSKLPKQRDSTAYVAQTLMLHPQIVQAVVITDKAAGQQIAYLVLDEDKVPTLEAIYQYAAGLLPDYLVPTMFVPIDKMPLLADGTVDVGSLPSTVNRRQSITEYVAPSTELESKLAAIWKRVLWLDRDVGIHDRFRNLGGHSLLSVQLVIQIEKELQRPIPAKALVTLDTVASMAEAFESAGEEMSVPVLSDTLTSGLSRNIYQGLRAFTASWEGARHSPDSVIVGLNTSGSEQNLFWCLQREYELSQLASYLGKDQPVYGMRSGNKVMIKTQENIDKLAAHYVSEILQIQPHGPFIIGGNCQAAKIAFQIATQLKQLGHSITLLFLHEKFIPFPYADPVALLFGRESDRNPYLSFHEPSIAWNKYYKGPTCSKIVSGGHGQFFQEPNIQDLAATLQEKIKMAQAGDFLGWTPATQQVDAQFLPIEAYRAQITGPADFEMKPDETMMLPVQIKNTSACSWQAAASSGINLANHWLNSKGKVVQQLDGRTPLPTSVQPGEVITLVLPVKAPHASGQWICEIDLVEQGLTWFKDQGSQTLRIGVAVKSERSGILNLLRRNYFS